MGSHGASVPPPTEEKSLIVHATSTSPTASNSTPKTASAIPAAPTPPPLASPVRQRISTGTTIVTVTGRSSTARASRHRLMRRACLEAGDTLAPEVRVADLRVPLGHRGTLAPTSERLLSVHWQLAVLALVLLGFAAISARIEGTPVTAPMVFTAAGLLVGVEALDLVDPSVTGTSVKTLAEATLTVVLFSDASRIDLGALRRSLGIPTRLLGIGLPLTILGGFVAALAVLGDLAWPEALVVAIILAPTDAALGQAVVTSRRLPTRVRQSLNVESGLNDGICVPLFLVALAVAQAEEGAIGNGAAAELVLEKIGFGIVGGVVAGALAAGVIVYAGGRRLVADTWLQVVPLAGALLAFGLAEAIDGSGFIAAFVGGLVFGGLRRHRGGEVSYLVEQTGAVLAAVTFVVFGAILLGPAIGDGDVADRPVRGSEPHGRYACSPSRSRCWEPARAGRRSASSAGSGREAPPRSCSRSSSWRRTRCHTRM